MEIIAAKRSPFFWPVGSTRPAASLLVAVVIASLGERVAAQAPQPAVWPKARVVDSERVGRFGLRVIRGDAVTLVTDLPASEEVNGLTGIADEALATFYRYFRVEPEQGWRALACMVGDSEKFAAAGLMPSPPHDVFPHGMSLGYEFWVNDQPTDYYRRALFLHELTHTFMSTRLGGTGPGWYAEAMAELMAAHRREPASGGDEAAGKLRLGVVPAAKSDSPMWGRIRLLREVTTPLTVEAVMRVDNRRPLQVDDYARVWALAKFMDTHPRYQSRWRELPRRVLDRDFNQQFRAAFADDWRRLKIEFALFTQGCEYGHDIRREAIAFADDAPPATTEPHRAAIRAGRGWQPAGVAVEQGQRYACSVSGQYVVAREPDGTPWPSTAGGVTLRYHGGQPLGRLMAAIDDGELGVAGGFLQPLPVGAAGQFRAAATGPLYLRVNDSPAELAENQGGLWVAVRLESSD